MTDPDPRAQQKGVAAALGAYASWGLLPIYFKAIASVNPWEIIAHRVIWGVPVLFLFLLARDGGQLWARLRITPRQAAWLILSGCLIACNWLVFIWAVANDRVLSTSLGYFINPLMNIVIGFLFLHERLNIHQKWGVSLAALGTSYLGWHLGQPPWIALVLAVTFAFYGLVRKQLDVGPMKGLMWEFILVLGPALGYQAWLIQRGQLEFLAGETVIDVLLMLAGFVTVMPLIFFNMAARRLTLTTLGFIQYLAPTMTFMLAVFLWGEPFTRAHAVAFGSIWTALALVSMGTLRRRMRAQSIDQGGESADPKRTETMHSGSHISE